MSTFDENRFDEWLDAYFDGDLSPAEVRRLEHVAANREELREELRLARALQHGLRSLPTPTCPPEVTTTVMAFARRDARRDLLERLRTAVASSWRTGFRPSLAVAVLIALVIGGALITRPRPAPQATSASTEEVERALNEARWALAFVSDIGRRTATSIRDEVFEERIVAPLNRALDSAFEGEPQVQ